MGIETQKRLWKLFRFIPARAALPDVNIFDNKQLLSRLFVTYKPQTITDGNPGDNEQLHFLHFGLGMV